LLILVYITFAFFGFNPIKNKEKRVKTATLDEQMPNQPEVLLDGSWRNFSSLTNIYNSSPYPEET
jgi:hypothetical protein